MFCSKCGHEMAEGVRFCAECGQPVGEKVVPAEVNEFYKDETFVVEFCRRHVSGWMNHVYIGIDGGSKQEIFIGGANKMFSLKAGKHHLEITVKAGKQESRFYTDFIVTENMMLDINASQKDFRGLLTVVKTAELRVFPINAG